MKARRIVASHVLFFAACLAGAQAQTSTAPDNQAATAESTTQPTAAELKAEKAQAKEAQRQAKYRQKAAKNRVNATKEQEKAVKTHAKANSQRDKAEIERAKAAKNDQQAEPQP
jgi:hypothetical protein